VVQGLVARSVARRVLLLACLAGGNAGWSDREALVGYVSGEELGKLVGLSRAAVHKHIEKLRTAGFAIERAAGTGYRLAQAFGDMLVPEAVVYWLLVQEFCAPASSTTPAKNVPRPDASLPAVGLPYYYLRECLSTNLALKESATSAVSGATVAADCQTAGRGRLDRKWVSEPFRDLAFSVFLRPRLGPSEAPLLSLAAAVAVVETLEAIPELKGLVGIKWPNDVMVEGKKVCGILLEAAMEMDQVQWAIVGIGVNVNSDPGALRRYLAEARPQEWRGRPEPVSLLALLGRPLPRAVLLAALLRSLAQCLALVEERDGRNLLLDSVRKRDVLQGRKVKVRFGHGPEESLEGQAEGLGPGGQLLVRSMTGDTFWVTAGDVVLLEETSSG